jgi:phosphopantothenoylcysteine decarboxylase/phosphopantothenate--cysteine ligase
MRFLITAGGTREPIDPVRFIANASSGKMGYALARAARDLGHAVTLISAPSSLRAPRGVTLIPVQTAQQMFESVQRAFLDTDVLIMAAAVADYRVARPSDRKLKKAGQDLVLHLEPTVDILQWAGEQTRERSGQTRLSRPFVVGFALEDADVKTRAEDKLRRKHIDLIVANRVSAIGADQSELHIKRPDGDWEDLPRAAKRTQARRLISRIVRLLH